MKKGRTLRQNERPINDAYNVLMAQRRINHWWIEDDGRWTVIGIDGLPLLAGGSKTDAKTLAGVLGADLPPSLLVPLLTSYTVTEDRVRACDATLGIGTAAIAPVAQRETPTQRLQRRIAELETELARRAS